MSILEMQPSICWPIDSRILMVGNHPQNFAKNVWFLHTSSSWKHPTNFGMGFLSIPFPPPQISHAYTGMIPRAFFRFKVEVEDLTTNAATAHGWSAARGCDEPSKQRTSLPIVRYCHYSIIGAGFIGMPGMKCWCDFANHLGSWWFALGFHPSHLSLLSARLPPHQWGHEVSDRLNKQDGLKVFSTIYLYLPEDSLSFPTAWGPEPPHPHVRSTISASIWKLEGFMVSWLVVSARFKPFEKIVQLDPLHR